MPEPLLIKCGFEGGSTHGNICALEHINICAPSHEMIRLFYIEALGCTPDDRRAQQQQQGYGTLW